MCSRCHLPAKLLGGFLCLQCGHQEAMIYAGSGMCFPVDQNAWASALAEAQALGDTLRITQCKEWLANN